MEESEKVRAPCGKCGRETNQIVHAKVVYDDAELVDDGRNAVGFYYWWELLQCNGCSFSQLRANRFFSEWDRHFDKPEISYWPPHEKRPRPGWLDELEEDRREALEEIYAGFDAGLYRLAMMGVRSFIDVFLTSLVGDLCDFPSKLRAAEDGGHIGTREREMLQAAIDAGHAAIHRGHTPSHVDVTTALEVAESVVGSHRLKSDVDSLKERTPRRNES